jgi:methylglutaconyl-CoA hydratase
VTHAQSPADETLLLARDARGVMRVTLNRPHVHNAFDEALIARLSVVFSELGRDSQARLIVLESTGKTFCAGADIEWMRRAATHDQRENLWDARRFATMMATIAQCGKPIIARIQGPAYGGGVGLACAADIAIASERARFSVSEAKFGILPAVIGPYLVNAVGPRQARRLALTCSVVSASEALALGLVQQVVAEEALDAAIEACIGELLQGGPDAQCAIKRLYGALQVGAVTEEVQSLTAEAISAVRATAEARAGFDAFLGKRPAPWIRT